MTRTEQKLKSLLEDLLDCEDAIENHLNSKDYCRWCGRDMTRKSSRCDSDDCAGQKARKFLAKLEKDKKDGRT